MTATVLQSRTTSGTLGVWGGTKDDQEGYIDYSNGATNLKSPRDIDMVAHDMRWMECPPTLMKNGYELVKIPTTVTAEQLLNGNTPEGKEYIQDVYFKECEKIIQEVSHGAGVIIPTSFRIRQESEQQKKLGEASSRYSPRPVAHLDRDTTTAITVLRETVGVERADELLSKYKHWAQVNVWRPIGAKATKWPLCFMNHDRIPDWDFATHTGRIYSRNDPRVADRGEKVYDCVAKLDSRYDYHYVSNLAPEECLVFCSFDSDPKLAVPHSAFWDHNTPEDAPIRRSIEVRSLVFF
ncbi:hypothetical protein K432DRAFT_397657 [Lepidopterella palustris CBS 459.81]|uniref:Methyltransferase n=1 Tax=Lepidopterella palustris CBS 459.81 TaxID=1314670 RepID=A0A8E2JAM7_9PEZI|nr:hypothetical protein K432DRAFT_397657 [Lepidopterella palustris CBS 459.81]